jgi:beta-glucosidase
MGGVKQNLRNLGIPPIFAIDGPAGMKTFNKCYQAPMGTASACTFNDELVKKVFQVIGKDMQKNGAPVLLGPGLNIHRDPTGGRNFEYFSEDPLLTGMMACNVVEGVQSQGIMAVPKHFAVNNQEKNRFTINECVSERALNEINLKGFEIVTKQAKTFCMMTTYNQLNGGTGHTNYNHSNFELITTLLKKT